MSDAITTGELVAGATTVGLVVQTIAVGVWKGKVDAALASAKADGDAVDLLVAWKSGVEATLAGIAAQAAKAAENHDNLTSKLDALLTAIGEMKGTLGILVGRRHDDHPHS